MENNRLPPEQQVGGSNPSRRTNLLHLNALAQIFATKTEDVLGMIGTHGIIQLVGTKAHVGLGRAVA